MRIAVFTPLNPVRCGVSDYSEELLSHLAKYFDITVFVDGYQPSSFGEDKNIRICPATDFNPSQFDEVVYHIGNNPHHVYAYETALNYPGIVVLHEFNLHHLIAAATIKLGNWGRYLIEAHYNGGPEALAFAKRVQALETGPNYDGLAMNKRLLECSKALIVHSRFLHKQVRKAGFGLPIAHIPHGAWIPEVNRHRYRSKLGLKPDTPLIGIFGFIKPYKRISESLRAMASIVRAHPHARMILVGEEHPDFPVRQLISQLHLDEFVFLLGHVDINEFEQWMGAIDICLNLRYPTSGETSGTLLRALGLGRAVIVSDVGSFSDLPENICLKVPVGETEIELIQRYLDLLITRPQVRRSIGEAARAYVAQECSWPHIADLYTSWIREIKNGNAEHNRLLPSQHTSITESSISSVAKNNSVAPSEKIATQNSKIQVTENDITSYLRGLSSPFKDSKLYLEQHLVRLIKTLELTPPGSTSSSILEMGAYMQITPALKHLLGYGEVRGCYLGDAGKADRCEVKTGDGRKFTCEIDLFNAEVDPYPYADGHFSTVLCCELLEHLHSDPMHMMKEINRILKPRGHLVLSTPNICSLRAVAAVLLGYHPGFFPQYIRPDKNGKLEPRHAREYAPRDIHVLFEAAGLEIIQLETGPYTANHNAEHNWVKHLINRYELSDQLRGEAIYAIGRKIGSPTNRYPASLYS